MPRGRDRCGRPHLRIRRFSWADRLSGMRYIGAPSGRAARIERRAAQVGVMPSRRRVRAADAARIRDSSPPAEC